MNPFDTVKSCLLEYPILFESRIDVFIYLFAVIGNGYDWENGELVDRDDEKYVGGMKYEDVDKNIADTQKELKDGPECLKGLNSARLVNAKFERAKREFIEKNIDVIAANPEATLINNYKIYMCYYMKDPCYDYAEIFHVPKDATPEWGEAAQEFAKFWRQRLYIEHHGFCYPKDGKYVYIKSPEDCWSEHCKKDFILAEKLKDIIDQIDINLGRKTHSEMNKEMARDIGKMLEKI